MSISINELRRTAEVAARCDLSDYGQRTTARLLEHAANTIEQNRAENEVLRWRIEAALKVARFRGIDSPQEMMEMILKGEYDNRRDEVVDNEEKARRWGV